MPQCQLNCIVSQRNRIMKNKKKITLDMIITVYQLVFFMSLVKWLTMGT